MNNFPCKPNELSFTYGLDIRGTHHKWAVFNAQHTRRYLLGRVWQPMLPPMVFAMCNASTADETTDDASVRKCIGFAVRRNCGAVVIINASPLISKDPKALLRDPHPCDLPNFEVVRLVLQRPCYRIAAWGTWPVKIRRAINPGVLHVLQLGGPLMCYGVTASGDPHHPSRIGYDTPLLWLHSRKPVDSEHLSLKRWDNPQ